MNIKIDIKVRIPPGKDFITGEEFIYNWQSLEYKSIASKNEASLFSYLLLQLEFLSFGLNYFGF